jgi:hypothetical protein
LRRRTGGASSRTRIISETQARRALGVPAAPLRELRKHAIGAACGRPLHSTTRLSSCMESATLARSRPARSSPPLVGRGGCWVGCPPVRVTCHRGLSIDPGSLLPSLAFGKDPTSCPEGLALRSLPRWRRSVSLPSRSRRRPTCRAAKVWGSSALHPDGRGRSTAVGDPRRKGSDIRGRFHDS